MDEWDGSWSSWDEWWMEMEAKHEEREYQETERLRAEVKVALAKRKKQDVAFTSTLKKARAKRRKHG
jgi:hypothetical protein